MMGQMVVCTGVGVCWGPGSSRFGGGNGGRPPQAVSGQEASRSEWGSALVRGGLADISPACTCASEHVRVTRFNRTKLSNQLLEQRKSNLHGGHDLTSLAPTDRTWGLASCLQLTAPLAELARSLPKPALAPMELWLKAPAQGDGSAAVGSRQAWHACRVSGRLLQGGDSRAQASYLQPVSTVASAQKEKL